MRQCGRANVPGPYPSMSGAHAAHAVHLVQVVHLMHNLHADLKADTLSNVQRCSWRNIMQHMLQALLAAVVVCIGAASEAQPFPSRSVTLTVGFAPGGGTDTAARVIAQ